MWLSHIIFQKHVADPTILKKKLWFLLFEVYLFVTASVCNLGHEQRLHVAGVSVVDIVTKQIYMNEFTALIMHCIRSSISNGFNLSLQWRQWLSNLVRLPHLCLLSLVLASPYKHVHISCNCLLQIGILNTLFCTVLSRKPLAQSIRFRRTCL